MMEAPLTHSSFHRRRQTRFVSMEPLMAKMTTTEESAIRTKITTRQQSLSKLTMRSNRSPRSPKAKISFRSPLLAGPAMLAVLLATAAPAVVAFAPPRVAASIKLPSVEESASTPRHRPDGGRFNGISLRSSSPASSLSLAQEKEFLKAKLPCLRERQLTKIEVEFREMLEALLYTDAEIESVTNPRLRAVVDGIAASYYEPAVYRAFEVLYEDYMPLRVAGRVVHGKLQKAVANYVEQRRVQTDAVVELTGADRGSVDAMWVAFGRLTETGQMTMDEAKASVAGPAVAAFGGRLSEEAVIQRLFDDPNATLDFQQLLEGLHRCRLDADASDQDFEGLLLTLQTADRLETGLGKKQQKYNDRYNDMLVRFAEWKDKIPSGEGRRLDILRGCFVGAENEKVVEALRIIYCDHSALRMSGNWIFRLVSAIMGNK